MSAITPELLAAAGTEQALQSAFFCWLAPIANKPGNEPLSWIHAIPSGGHREKIVATMMKGAGVRRGVWDICLPFPRAHHPFGYIEMKRPKYRLSKWGGLTQEQRDFGIFQLKNNAFLRIAYDWTEARDYTLEYFAITFP